MLRRPSSFFRTHGTCKKNGILIWKEYSIFGNEKNRGNIYECNLMVRVFAHGLGDLGSIPGQVIPKTQKKWYSMPLCLILRIIKYRSRVMWVNPGKGVAPSPIPQCSSYQKGSLRVTFDYGQLVENLIKLGSSSWLKFQEQLKNLHSSDSCQSAPQPEATINTHITAQIIYKSLTKINTIKSKLQRTTIRSPISEINPGKKDSRETFSKKTDPQIKKKHKTKPICHEWMTGNREILFRLVGWVLWHINLCRLFNAKSIFM